MTPKVKKIISEIQALEPKKFEALKEWFFKLQWEKWDEEIRRDSDARRLDFFIEEARQEKKKGQLKEL